MFCVILAILNSVGGEWVEISPITTNTNYSIGTVAKSATTPPSLEVVMKTPYSKFHESTTPVYDNFNRKTFIEEDLNFDDLDMYPNSSFRDTSDDIHEDNVNNEETFDKIRYNGFFSFLRLVQKNLLKLTARESKLSVLKHLRNVMLNNLYTRISKLWKPTSEREARGHKEEYEMEFPSNEGALLTIGFLTFAVFLIKLVIKLVQALKYKYTYYATTTTTTAATVLLLKRKKREEEFNEESAKILTYLEKYPDFDQF